jgi:hypothetical protein
MPRGSSFLLAVLAAGLGLAATGHAQEKSSPQVFKWTDEKGVVHYGDSVPSQYSQGERSVLNSQGVEVGHVDGSYSNAASAERERVAEVQAKQQQHDQFLLATYLSTHDIEQLRDERLGQIDGQIRAAGAYIDSLDARLGELLERAKRFKPYNADANARRMPDDLAEELIRAKDESSNQRRALDIKRKELSDTRSQFESDIDRYRQLTTRHGS